MLKKFFKYLLIGFSAMVLLAAGQQGLFIKQEPIAQAANCDPDGGVDPNTWSLIEEWACEPGNPGVKAHQWACFGDDGTPHAVKYTDGVSDTNKCPMPQPPAAAASASQFPCESNPGLCGANETFCEQTGDNLSEFIFKHEGACHPENNEHDANGCIYIYTPQAPVYHNNTCQIEAAPVQQPVQQQVQQQVQQIQQVVQPPPPPPPGPVCRSINCTPSPAGCAYNNQITNTCDPNVTLTCGNLVCNPTVTPPAAPPITITNNPVNTNTNTNTNNNTITVNNPVPPAARVVLAQAAPVIFGNVGVGQTVYTAGVQYTATQLPKTGLPSLVWSALAFVPAGFRMRRFSKLKKDLENHPSYIWEDRQFKSQV